MKGEGGSTPAVGGGVPIVNSVDKLNPKSPLGSLACVVEQGSIKESSFRDLYQPDESMLDQNTGALTAPELLSGVSSVRVFAPKDITSVGFEPVETMIYLIPRDFSASSQSMGMVQIMPLGVMAMTMIGGYDTMQQLVLAEYSQDTMSYTIHNDQVEAFNAVLANGMDWCYFGNPAEDVITEEQFATIDLFVKAVAGIPSKAHVYLKKDNWEELYAKDFEKLASNIGKVEESVNAKADKIPIKSYVSYEGLKPNVYTTYNISSTGSTTIELADITENPIYNEYIIQIRCASTPSSVVFTGLNNTEIVIKWANGPPPTFEAGNIYLISIVNGFGVYSMFPNS
jgi:hypothetical protein